MEEVHTAKLGDYELGYNEHSFTTNKKKSVALIQFV